MVTKRSTRKEVYASPKARAEKRAAGSERSFVVPEGKNLFSVKKAGMYRLDIVAYPAGKGNPFCDEGLLAYERTFYVHYNIGPNQSAQICLAKTFNEPCPPCEWRSKETRKADADAEAIDSVKWKERQLFNVFDHSEPERGWQLWEIAYFNFGKLLDARIRAKEKYEGFAKRKGGYTLEVTFGEETTGSNKYLKAVAIDFEAREEDYGEEIYEELACLDDLIVPLPYDEYKELFLQTGGDKPKADDEDDESDDEDDDEPAPRKRKAAKPPVDEDDEDDADDEEPEDDADDDDEEDPPPRKKKVAPKKAPVKKKAAEPDEDDDSEDDESDDDDEDDEPPPRKTAKKKAPVKKKPPVDDDDWGDDDEDEPDEDEPDEDDEPAPRKRKASAPPKRR